MCLSWQCDCQSVHISHLLKPSMHPTAFGIESKILSLDSRPAFPPPFYSLLLLCMEAPLGQSSVYCGPRTDLCHAHPLLSLMLSPQYSIPRTPHLLPLPPQPSTSHAEPICEFLFIPQNPSQVASETFFCLYWSSLLMIFPVNDFPQMSGDPGRRNPQFADTHLAGRSGLSFAFPLCVSVSK